MSWFLYILRCGDGSFYAGITQDVEERLKRHNVGDGAAYTRAHRPVSLAFVVKYETYKEARRREMEVKKWGRRKKEELIQSVGSSHSFGANFAPRNSAG